MLSSDLQGIWERMKWTPHQYCHQKFVFIIVLPEAELLVVDVKAGLELVVGRIATLPQVLAQDAGQVGQVLDPHRPVWLDRHLVQDEVVPILDRAHNRLLHLLLDVVLHLRRLQTDPDPEWQSVYKIEGWRLAPVKIQQAVIVQDFSPPVSCIFSRQPPECGGTWEYAPAEPDTRGPKPQSVWGENCEISCLFIARKGWDQMLVYDKKGHLCFRINSTQWLTKTRATSLNFASSSACSSELSKA